MNQGMNEYFWHSDPKQLDLLKSLNGETSLEDVRMDLPETFNTSTKRNSFSFADSIKTHRLKQTTSPPLLDGAKKPKPELINTHYGLPPLLPQPQISPSSSPSHPFLFDSISSTIPQLNSPLHSVPTTPFVTSMEFFQPPATLSVASTNSQQLISPMEMYECGVFPTQPMLFQATPMSAPVSPANKKPKKSKMYSHHARTPCGKSSIIKLTKRRKNLCGGISRKKTNIACTNCVKAKAGCDTQRPCTRCVRLGKGATCIDRELKNNKSKTRSPSQMRQEFEKHLERQELQYKITQELENMSKKRDYSGNFRLSALVSEFSKLKNPIKDCFDNRFESSTAEIWMQYFNNKYNGYCELQKRLIASLLGYLLKSEEHEAKEFALILLAIGESCNHTSQEPIPIKFLLKEKNVSYDLQLDFNLEQDHAAITCFVHCSERVWNATNSLPMSLIVSRRFDLQDWNLFVSGLLAVVGHSLTSSISTALSIENNLYPAFIDIKVEHVSQNIKLLRLMRVLLKNDQPRVI